MEAALKSFITSSTGAHAARRGEVIQSLWSGYGEIVRISLEGSEAASAILKHVRFPDEADHPRGWHSDFAHRRKVRSYEVEMHWYSAFSQRCDDNCRVPHCYASATLGDDHLILLEDLDAAGFPVRKSWLNRDEIHQCLSWLAHFHARFMHTSPSGLWPVGTYWHLATRPDEWAAMPDGALKQTASAIDAALNSGSYTTLVHSDAKVANFCFARHGAGVAAVDFQYVGAGCGMKDVAYLLGSCLRESQLTTWQGGLLDDYFTMLHKALKQYAVVVDGAELETEWRQRYPIAVADFSRFLAGWMPDHWKVNDHNQQITDSVARQLSRAENSNK